MEFSLLRTDNSYALLNVAIRPVESDTGKSSRTSHKLKSRKKTRTPETHLAQADHDFCVMTL